MNFFNLTLSEKHFIFPSILNDSFAGYSNLRCRSLRLILMALVLKFILSDMSIATLALFPCPFAWNICFQPFIFSLCRSFVLRWVSCRQHMYGSCYVFFVVVQVQLSALPPTTPHHPSHPYLLPLLLPLFGFAHVSFIVVPENSLPPSSRYPLPSSLRLLSTCS